MAQGGTLAASPEEDRDVGGLSYTCCKQVSPATTWRRLPGRVEHGCSAVSLSGSRNMKPKTVTNISIINIIVVLDNLLVKHFQTMFHLQNGDVVPDMISLVLN